MDNEAIIDAANTTLKPGFMVDCLNQPTLRVTSPEGESVSWLLEGDEPAEQVADYVLLMCDHIERVKVDIIGGK